MEPACRVEEKIITLFSDYNIILLGLAPNLMTSLQLVWLVWRCTDIADRTQCLNPGNPEFFTLSFCNCISCFCNCNEWSSLHLVFVSNKNPLKGRIARAADYCAGPGTDPGFSGERVRINFPQKSTILGVSRGMLPLEKFWHPGP